MADALARRRMAVTVVDRAPQPMSTLDPDMGELVHRAMEKVGIDVRTDATVTGLRSTARPGSVGRDQRRGRTRRCSRPRSRVRPNTALANQAGLPLGDHGGLRTDTQMRVLGHDRLWAGGDCVEVLNLVSDQYEHIPLGTHANKHGRVIGHNIAGSTRHSPAWSERR
jgi:NADPH-dependent 2,4-dienoyl-CoA reductase/sulfur reductase-like enzyme